MILTGQHATNIYNISKVLSGLFSWHFLLQSVLVYASILFFFFCLVCLLFHWAFSISRESCALWPIGFLGFTYAESSRGFSTCFYQTTHCYPNVYLWLGFVYSNLYWDLYKEPSLVYSHIQLSWGTLLLHDCEGQHEVLIQRQCVSLYWFQQPLDHNPSNKFLQHLNCVKHIMWAWCNLTKLHPISFLGRQTSLIRAI